MELIIHRINKVLDLDKVPRKYGVEIDIRAYGKNLVLNHEPYSNGDTLEEYLSKYDHGTLVLNVKEAGIEDDVLQMVRSYEKIKSYFLLDVEFPYLYRSAKSCKERNIAVRYSEDESIETVKKYTNLVDWVWIDTNTEFPIDKSNYFDLNKFKKCLVCPDRWGRPNDINNYRQQIKNNNFYIDAVMTSYNCIDMWLK